MSDFLPPWLQDLDEPEEPKSKPSASPPPAHADDADDGIAIPPWLMDADDKPKEFIKATGEFSDDFLAAGDDLPETSVGSVTYDEWRRIQQEKQRERSIEEEVPDLLNDELPSMAFPEGTMKLPDTGELPDWFLGLEELDDSQAPDWFSKPSPRGTTPLPPEPAPAPPVPPTPPALPAVTISPDLFASIMQPDLNDEPPTTPAPRSGPFGADMDDFFGSVEAQRQPEAQNDDDFFELPDFGSDTDSQQAVRVDALPSVPAYSSLDDFDFDEPDLTNDVEPTVTSRSGLSMAAMMPDPAAPPPPPEPTLESVSAVDMSWLDEINLIVGNVIQSEQGEDEDTARYAVVPPTTDYLTTDKRPKTAPLIESGAPDWLSQIEAMPDQLEQEETYAATTDEDAEDAARPIVDFSEFDFSSFDTPEPQTSDPFAGMFDNIAAVQTSEQKQVAPEPQPPKRRTDGSTVLLPEDGPVPQGADEDLTFDFQALPPAPPAVAQTQMLSDELERLIGLKTGELDQALFAPDAPPAPAELKRKTAEELDRLAQMRTDEVEALFEFEELMQPQPTPAPPAPPKPAPVPIPVVDDDSVSSVEPIVPLLPFDDSPIPPPKPLRKAPAAAAPVIPPVTTQPPAPAPVKPPAPAQPAPQEEDMSWLSSVRFEDDAPAAVVPQEMARVPAVQEPPVEETREMAELFSALQEENKPRTPTEETFAALYSGLEETPSAPAPVPEPADDDGMHALYTGLLSAPPEDQRYNTYTAYREPASPIQDSPDELEPDAFTRLFGGRQPSLITDEPAPRETYTPAASSDSSAELMPDDDALFRALFGESDTSSGEAQSMAPLQEVAPEQPPSSPAGRVPSPPADIDPVDALLQSYDNVQPETGAAPVMHTGELNALFNEESPQTDDLSGLLSALGAVPATAPQDADMMQGFIANTGELDALFGQDEEADFASAEPAPGYSANTGELNALFGEAQDEEIDDRSFLPGTAELDARFGNLFAQENAMPANDDFDKLFAGFDDDSAGEPSDELPGTGSLSGYDSEAIAPNDDDLTALFSAFEEEHRQTPNDDADLGTEFADDDSFFAALGLDREPPGGGDPPPKKPGDEDPWNFLEPEVSKTTYTSGTSETSMWEDEAEASLTGSAGGSVFDFDAAPTEWAEEDTFEPYVSDWAEDDAPAATIPPAPPAPSAAFDNTPLFRDWELPTDFLPSPPPAVPPVPAVPVVPASEEPLPDWLSSIDTQGAIDDTHRVPGGLSAVDDTSAWMRTEETPEPDLESYLAGLDDGLDAVLPPGADLSRPINSTAEFDIDQMFDEQFQMPDAPVSETASDVEALARADLLDELQASVGAVSAVAIARQMQDRSEAELDDRLKRLRQRGTAELPAAPVVSAPEDNVNSVLPGMSDTLAPAPVVLDTPNLVGDAQLTETQRERLAVAQDLTGTTVDAEGRITQTQDVVAVGEAAPIRTTLPMTVVTAPPAPVRKKRLYRIDRLLVSLALLLGIGLPFFVQEARIGALPPTTFAAGSGQEAVFEQVDQLEEFDLVLVGLDYGPAAAAELDPMTDALVRHVLLRGARPIFISGNPFGVLRAQSFIDRINADNAFLERINQTQPLEANVEYYAARFLPGSAVGLRAFSEATAALLTIDINAQTRGLNLESLANIALIMLITDRAEDVRAYAEQIAPLATRPLVAAVNYGSAPLAQPYVAEALSGVLVGYSDALTYSALLPAVEAVERGPRPILPQDAEPSVTPAADESVPDAQATPGVESTEEAEATPTPEPEPVLIATVTSANGANVRSGPGTDFNVIAGLRRNAEVVVLEVTEDWLRVQLDDGREGWVSAGLVVIREATPVPEGTPGASSGIPGTFLRPLFQADDAVPVEIGANDALRWYAMTMGIIVIVVIIVLGSLIGLIGGILRRRSAS
ncbi:MAG: SH3 domain-containing protein [Chloroflexota bacterium]|nr:SH3 domain-containing protein [Chloroflexota bacterium]